MPGQSRICAYLCEVRARASEEDTRRSSSGGSEALSLCAHRAPLMAARQPAAEQQQQGTAEPPMDVDAVQQLQSGDEPDGGDSEEGGGMADGSESGGGMQDDSDDGGVLDEDQDQDDEIDYSEGDNDNNSDSDGHDDGYEEEGHPVVPITSVDVPDGFLGAEELEARFPYGTSDVTKSLGLGVIGRTIPSAQHVTDLIEQGANPNIKPRLRKKGSKHRGFPYPLLAIVIDNKSDYTVLTIEAGDDDACRPVAPPRWSSAGLQAEIFTALLDGGADPNAEADETGQTSLRVTIRCGNQEAFDVLTARHDIDLRPPGSRTVMALPLTLCQPPPEYLQLLLSMYEQLIARDHTLATEERYGYTPVRHAAFNSNAHYPQSFIDAYLDLIAANGADMTAADGIGWTPLHRAAAYGSPKVADYLCRKLPADQIDRRTLTTSFTPLSVAAYELYCRTQQLQHPNTPEATTERHRAQSGKFKLIIRSLLRAGADITSITTITTIPTAIERDRRRRQLVLAEYTTVLNEVPTAVMAAVTAALAPHRSLAALLTPRLAVGPQEAPIFGWRIASYLFDMDAAQEAIGEAIGVRHTDMARRVCATAEHFVKSAVYQASSNREAVGGTAEVGGQVVRVPQLQCFVVGGVGGRKMELREVVQRAILDEAAKWGLVGDIDNGFTKDVAAVVWGAVGWVEKGRDGRVSFRSLRMT
ncbi:unnamed protein product [Vitrella brassicaformis CCMP3155]|uniref:Uncharacterized protein n=1 Tax=Vitrella brassicaformis (strain CCMP3155) TaxID=1169540 RepID=A0A0G4ECW4_VITBC|nr:unnamed protein product [Vitrella brassicaformis CCMP3155]|eukprot:CEL93397.1 unnamed protein product [Vitrella brassicaformis CCMP3155]